MMKRIACMAFAAVAALSTTAPVMAEDDVTTKLVDTIKKLSPEQQASLFLMLNSLKASAGSGAAEVTDPEAAVRGVVEKMKAALEEQSIDQLAELFSDEFYHPQVGGKEEAKTMLEMGLDSGYAEGGEVSLESMEITKEDDGSYSVYPIDLSSDMGSVAVEIVVKKEDGGWKITTLDVEGI